MRIMLPKLSLNCGVWQVERFLTVISPCWSHPGTVTIDFTDCGFLSSEGAAIIASLRLTRQKTNGASTEIDWDTVQAGVMKQLKRWDITKLFQSEDYPHAANAVPLFHQGSLQKNELVNYVDKWIISGDKLPAMTVALQKHVRTSFCELFTNIFEHANSAMGGVAIGQFHPRVKEVQICVGDTGTGLVSKVQQAGHGKQSASSAIEWALTEGTSTREGNVPGGLGLYLLRSFVRANGGGFHILANRGYFCENAGKAAAYPLVSEYPGTLVQFRFLIKDDDLYALASE